MRVGVAIRCYFSNVLLLGSDWCVGAGVPVPDLSALLVDAPEPLSTQVSVVMQYL